MSRRCLGAHACGKRARLVVVGDRRVVVEAVVSPSPEIPASVYGHERPYSAVYSRQLPRDLRPAVHAHYGNSLGVDISQFGEHSDGAACHFHPLEPRGFASGGADVGQIAETGGSLRVRIDVGIGSAGILFHAGEIARIVAKAHHIPLSDQRKGDIVESAFGVARGQQKNCGTGVSPAPIESDTRKNAHPSLVGFFGREKDVRCRDITLFAGGNYGSLRSFLDGIEPFPHFRRSQQSRFHNRNYSPKGRQSKEQKGCARARTAAREHALLPRATLRAERAERTKLRRGRRAAKAPCRTRRTSATSSRRTAAENPYSPPLHYIPPSARETQRAESPTKNPDAPRCAVSCFRAR